MEQPKASIIITSYNKPQYLKVCIDSCLQQTYNNIEIIIADDNSSNPEVWNLINSYSDQRIIKFNSFISNEDRLKTARYATQINTAVRNFSTGKYLFYLPDDDYFYSEKVRMHVEFAEANGYDVTYSAEDFIDASGNLCGIRYNNTPDNSPKVLESAFAILDHSQVVTSRKVYDIVGGWDDSPVAWGDADAHFWNRISSAGYRFYPLPFVRLSAKRYREHSVQWNIANNLPPYAES